MKRAMDKKNRETDQLENMIAKYIQYVPMQKDQYTENKETTERFAMLLKEKEDLEEALLIITKDILPQLSAELKATDKAMIAMHDQIAQLSNENERMSIQLGILPPNQ